ncbi:hypothetical protein [Alishewanella tabrizica]|uniref:hypothetical protein n=1 Tax=Alishewanella tabrizica TaxID=671278 RepID=UPI001671967F|nr:hypothetical protein [Alishewanella tabrizica]
MLNFYRRLARWGLPYKHYLGMVAAVIAITFVWMLFNATSAISEQWLLPLLVLFTLCVWLWLVVSLLHQDNRSKLGRIKGMLYAIWQKCLAILLTAILLVWSFLFLKMLSGIIRHLFF